MTVPVLELRHIHFTYPDSPPALCDVSAAFYRAERIALLGGNGAGKSTLLRLCAGVLRPRGGEMLLHGALVATGSGAARADAARALHREVGLVFQDPDKQIIGPTVAQDISFGPLNLRMERSEVTCRVEAALTGLGLQALRDRPPHQLSGGEKRRLTLADVLVMEPALVLLDEPTASLDAQGLDMLSTLLADAHARGIALLVASHDADFVWEWADRVLVLHEGALIAEGLAEQVFADAALLARAGLRRPLLFEVAVQLRRAGLMAVDAPWPRTLAGLAAGLA